MLRLLVLMISIGLADSLNPSTIAPALYLASREHPRVNLAEFTLAVFVVYLAGGCLIALGPGELIRNAISNLHVEEEVRYGGQVVAGVLLITGAVIIWKRRGRMVARGMPGAKPKRRSGALLGASIMAVELPTAFPYFAAIAAVVGSGLGLIRGLILLLVFNVCFILPLLAIQAVVTFGGDRTGRLLARARGFLERRWPHVLVVILALVGAVAIVFGVTGFGSDVHGHVGTFFRHVKKRFHLHF
jgi:cytochrome c biogenesis protein CcdA